MRRTQVDKILDYLKTHDSITTIEAFNKLGCTRLAAQVFYLKQKGYNITSTMKKVKTENGTTTIAEYSLVK